MSSRKIKILLVGSVGENFDILQKKLSSLHGSKAGPFDACFCVGPINIPSDPLEADNDGTAKDFKLPLPVYLQDYSGPLPSTYTGKGDAENGNSSAKIVPLGLNLFYLRGDPSFHKRPQGTGGSIELLEIKLPNHEHELVVGCCPKNFRAPSVSSTAASAKVGELPQCDILFSSDWPQGMEDVVNVETEPLSFDIGHVAIERRPRYHVSPSSIQFHQSPPYALPKSDHVCRFLALAPVIREKATKTTKFVHALGLVPLAANPPPTTAASTLPCPFSSSLLSSSNETSSSNANKKFDASGAGMSGYSRFATNSKKRGRGHNDGNDDQNDNGGPVSLEPPDDPNLKTLFLYGLHKDVTGQLQSTRNGGGRSRILEALASRFGVIEVRYPPGAVPTSTYCFLEFPEQKMALKCLLDCRGRLSIDSVDLTLKWATPNNQNNKRSRPNHSEQHYVTEAEAPNSTTLYYHPPKHRQDQEQVANDEDFATSLCGFLQKTLEDTLNEGNEDDSERITADTEPALKVTVRRKDQYGFLEFASHAAATMALAAVTNSTDGGFLGELENGSSEEQNATKKTKPPTIIVGTTLRWAKGEAHDSKPSNKARQEVLEALGLERKYYPQDSRTDCWFCLASPTCETHLITGVYKDWYATMPKGPVHPGHVLLVTVTHTEKGALTMSDSALSEWKELVDRLFHHASQAYDCDLLVFERAMETKGGYHSHVNCVPIPRITSNSSNTSTTLQATLMAHAKACGFELRRIQSDLGVQSLLSDDGQYFYAEIRTSSDSHRFLYAHDASSAARSSVVPLQFAREVLASVLQNPKLAHWKSCVVDKEQETQLAKDFRQSFAKHTPGAETSKQ